MTNGAQLSDFVTSGSSLAVESWSEIRRTSTRRAMGVVGLDV